MHTSIINTISLAPCHSDMFEPSKANLQAVRQI